MDIKGIIGLKMSETLLLLLSNLIFTARNKKKPFEPITKQEFLTFFGWVIMMGIKREPSYRDYWSINHQLTDPYISPFMPINRFFFILSHFHLNDNEKEPGRNDQNYNKLYKVKPLIDILAENYKKFYSPTRKQAIDESMIKFKGRSSMKQHMPNKPIKRGYKVWVRADEYGYTSQFKIYTGKVNGKSEKSLGPREVQSLSSDLANQHYEIYFDNYFSSVDLMTSLKNKNINACGTI